MQMVTEGQYLAVFNSSHRVLQAERNLKKLRLPIMLIPAPRAVQADCGLAIRFDQELRDTVMRLLAEHNLLPAFLCQLKDGSFITLEEFNHEND